MGVGLGGYPERWLILADDLTGAADCAIAFARGGMRASVGWGAGDGFEEGDVVRAIDADSRRLSPAAAAARHLSLLERHHGEGVALFKKMDSTLRGQPAAELAAVVRSMSAGGRGPVAIVTPAFPATGRTVEGGCVRLHGEALEETALWARDRSYGSADLAAVLREAGLRVGCVGLAAVRGGGLRAALEAAVADGAEAVVCDAVLAEDLAAVAAAGLALAGPVVWTGSGGLALALAERVAAGASRGDRAVGISGRILFVVGSVAEASRAASAVLGAEEGVVVEVVEPALLLAGPGGVGWEAAGGRIAGALARGGDVLVEVAAGEGVDLARGAVLAGQLGALLRPAAGSVGALFATGGETALALLDGMGVTGIEMLEEIEPGVPLGLTRGALRVPVVTKAGAFGDAGTLRRCLYHLRRMGSSA